MNLENVSPFDLIKNPWNSNVVNRDNLNRLKASLDTYGAFKPVTVRELPSGEYQILGGYHRVEMAKELGWKTIPIIDLGIIDDDTAKQISLVDNKRYGEDDPELLEKLLGELDDLEAFEDLIPMELEDLEDDVNLADLIETPMATLADDDTRTLKFRIDADKAEEIENALLGIAKTHRYKKADGYSDLAEALYHVLILEKR